MKLVIFVAWCLGSLVSPLIGGERTMLEVGHLDLAFGFDGENWNAVIDYDEVFPPLEIEPELAVLIVRDGDFPDDGSRVVVNVGPPGGVVGAQQGEFVWLVPISQDGFIDPGFSNYQAEGLAQGAPIRFDFPQLDYFGDGVGHLGMYKLGFAGPEVFFSSNTEISSVGYFDLNWRGHDHVNWVFSDPGIYRLWIQPSGLRVAGDESSREVGDPVPILFAVAVDEFSLWALSQGIEVGEVAIDSRSAVGGLPLGLYYALGLPLDERGWSPQVGIIEVANEDYASLSLPAMAEGATGVAVVVEFSEDLVEWHRGDDWVQLHADEGDEMVYRTAQALSESKGGFFRLVVEKVAVD